MHLVVGRHSAKTQWWNNVFGHPVPFWCTVLRKNQSVRLPVEFMRLPTRCTCTLSSTSHLDASARRRPECKSTSTTQIYFSYLVLLAIKTTIFHLFVCHWCRQTNIKWQYWELSQILRVSEIVFPRLYTYSTWIHNELKRPFGCKTKHPRENKNESLVAFNRREYERVLHWWMKRDSC